MTLLSSEMRILLFAGYVLVFGLSAIVCFVGLLRARHIDDDDTRRGLVALLATSGLWAASHVVFLVVPTLELKRAFYQFGLIVGISTIGPWLYFCSAYTGRTLHRAAPFRRAAVGLFLGIVAVKLTNPIHGLYFQTAWVTTPFPHLSVQHQLLHWVTTGLAYSLAAIGYFMLVELFWQIDHDTKPLVVLVGLTGLPVLFNVLGLVSPRLLDITYEPIGVAAFAAGVLFIYLEEFQTVQLAGEHDEPIIVLDDDDEVRDYNRRAEEIFPTLESGERIDVVVPELMAYLDADDTVLEVDRGGGVRYYQVSAHPFSAGRSRTGRAITLADVTDREQYRTELERQNERLEQFASVVSHDLRNPLNVAKGRIELAREEHESEHLETASDALDRMAELTDELLTLARQGQPIDETDPVSLSTVVEQCWQMVDTQSATLRVDDDIEFLADTDRLQQLLENLFRNAIEHAGADVTIRVGSLPNGRGFYVEDDGPGIPAQEREEVFASGYSTTDHGTGFGLAIVEEIVDAHGWSIAVTDGRDGGARFEITGVDRVEDSKN